MEAAKEALPPQAKMAQCTVRQIVKEHSRLFQALPPAGQAAFHRAALQSRPEMTAEVQAELDHLRTARQLGKARLNEELLQEGLLNRAPLARFGEGDYRSMEHLLATPEFAFGEVARKRESLAQGPKAPPQEVIDALGKCSIYAAPLLEASVPEWQKRLCWNRSEVQERGIAILIPLEEDAVAYFFPFATQSPLEAMLKPMTLKVPVAPCLEGAGQGEVLEHCFQMHNFSFEISGEAYVSGSSLPCVSGEGVVVIQGLTFDSPGVLVTDIPHRLG